MNGPILEATISSTGQAIEIEIRTSLDEREIIDRALRSAMHQVAMVTRTGSTSRLVQSQFALGTASNLVQRLEEELEEREWDALFNTPSLQQRALKALIAEGRKQYAAGETEEIVGETFASTTPRLKSGACS